MTTVDKIVLLLMALSFVSGAGIGVAACAAWYTRREIKRLRKGTEPPKKSEA